MINNDSILNAVTRYYDDKRFKAQNTAYEINEKLNQDERWVNNRYAVKDLSLSIAKAEFLGDTNNLNKLKEKRELLLKERALILKEKGLTEKDLTPAFECDKCKDTGYIHGGGFCDCFFIALSQVCENLLNLKSPALPTFDDFKVVTAEDEKNKKLFTTYIEKFPPEKCKNLLIGGDTGTGKTFCAGCIASAIKGKNFNTIFLSAVKLGELFLRYHTASINDKLAIFSLLTTCDLLVIDDLGTEPILSNVTVPYLTAVLSERIANGAPFIITTNLTLLEIKERYTERLFSRLSGEETARISFKGKDKRLKK